jgi:hypothetical protein
MRRMVADPVDGGLVGADDPCEGTLLEDIEDALLQLQTTEVWSCHMLRRLR